MGQSGDGRGHLAEGLVTIEEGEGGEGLSARGAEMEGGGRVCVHH